MNFHQRQIFSDIHDFHLETLHIEFVPVFIVENISRSPQKGLSRIVLPLHTIFVNLKFSSHNLNKLNEPASGPLSQELPLVR